MTLCQTGKFCFFWFWVAKRYKCTFARSVLNFLWKLSERFLVFSRFSELKSWSPNSHFKESHLFRCQWHFARQVNFVFSDFELPKDINAPLHEVSSISCESCLTVSYCFLSCLSRKVEVPRVISTKVSFLVANYNLPDS